MLLESCMCGALAFFFVSFPCELGQRFSDAFNHIDYMMGQINWYLLPINIRKTLPITIQYTQKSFAIRFFGSHSCSRKQLKKASVRNLQIIFWKQYYWIHFRWSMLCSDPSWRLINFINEQLLLWLISVILYLSIWLE